MLGDTGFCSYAHLAILLERGNHAVFRMHQKQIVNFTPGRAMPTKRSSGANLEGLPHSLWLRCDKPALHWSTGILILPLGPPLEENDESDG